MDYRVTVTMDATTAAELSASGNALSVYRAVTATDPAARPVVWASIPFSTTTQISWTDQWCAYTSTSGIVAGERVTAGFSVAIEAGQTLQVGAAGLGTVVDGGAPAAICVHNTTDTAYTCGVSCAAGGDASPFCVLPLHGQNLQSITPLQTVLLQFTNRAAAVGTIIDDTVGRRPRVAYTYTPGYLVELAPDAADRRVGFDIDTGWSNAGGGWARTVPADASLTRLLIGQ